MANIALRNPQFKFIVASAGARSVVCKVTIDGTLRYTLTKNLPIVIAASQTINFDIAELARELHRELLTKVIMYHRQLILKQT